MSKKMNPEKYTGKIPPELKAKETQTVWAGADDSLRML